MSVRFFNRDPNTLFPLATSYTKEEVDTIFVDLSSSGVTQSAMSYALQDFISEEAIINIMVDYVRGYISQTSINSKFNVATANFWTSDEIDSALSGNTSYFYNTAELHEFASAYTDDYQNGQEVFDNALSAFTLSQFYWHPEPFYERTLYTDDTTYSLGGESGDQIDIYVSGNTYWNITESIGEVTSWISLSTTTGETSLIVTVTATEDNGTGSARDKVLTFNAVQIYGVPFNVTLTQIYEGKAS